MGGESAEREISLRSGRAVMEALSRRGYRVAAVDADRNTAAKLRRAGAKRAFVALHGGLGEDGSVQGLLEVMAIPYTGSGVRASAVAMDKALAKRILSSYSIETPPFTVVERGGSLSIPRGLKLPLVVKPVAQGSSKGIAVVRSRRGLEGAVKEALRYGPVMIESFVEGRELTAAVLDGEALPVVEIRPSGELFDYESKYVKGKSEYFVPARIGAAAQRAVRRLAVRTYRALGCRGAARVDMILAGDGPTVLEVNTVPGMTETSLLPMAAEEAGMSYDELVERILAGAALEGRAGPKPPYAAS
ncbi:MAG TPA: D-alanine--D-alanine ligase [Deltaproteobacteria bacterium]|nr:D-alanine--D-alanine ligase [Deltaproteobacteria bacterium]